MQCLRLRVSQRELAQSPNLLYHYNAVMQATKMVQARTKEVRSGGTPGTTLL
jgi:hypothetical protein